MYPGEARVVIVHDYLTQRGGAERVALDLLRAFPGARLVTSCWNPATTYSEFNEFDIETLWIDKVGPLRRDPRRAFPMLARAFSRHVITDADIVICSSSGWAHRVRTTAPKIVYCHNPARWLYQPDDYFVGIAQSLLRPFVTGWQSLRGSDISAAHSAARYVVNSSAVASRVEATYGMSSTLVPPARGLSVDGPVEPVPGIEPGYLLTISRARAYKHVATVVEAVASMPDERLVVVGGDAGGVERGAVRLNSLTDAQLRWIYANAAGLIAIAHEDFGLTPIEAQAFGVPSVVLRSGGYLDSTVEHTTGVFVDDVTAAEVSAGIRELRAHRWDGDVIRKHGERYAPDAFRDRIRAVVAQVQDWNSMIEQPAFESSRTLRAG